MIEECKTFQTTNDELRMQNLELHRECTVLDSKLGESQIVFSGMLKLVEELECKFTSMLEEIALKEKIRCKRKILFNKRMKSTRK